MNHFRIFIFRYITPVGRRKRNVLCSFKKTTKFQKYMAVLKNFKNRPLSPLHRATGSPLYITPPPSFPPHLSPKIPPKIQKKKERGEEKGNGEALPDCALVICR